MKYLQVFIFHLKFSISRVCSRIHKFGHQLSRQLQIGSRYDELFFLFSCNCVWCCFQLHRCCFLLLQGVGCAPDVCRLFCRESRCCSQVYRECGVRLLLCAILCCVPFYCVCCVWLLGSGLYSSNFFCCFVV
ncbi:uncharacterized protein [Spinacia oleracea]|uniref:Uncharacterized protein isoform X3 n=1 Tax=Spinacia oleracea TaxID=3562 RepID=A0ABM3RD15_SPIOL|nr:uncharacterized protein LOC130459061 isoform X3 [Spinacia oleracea]